MTVLIVLASLAFLIYAAYRGFSVIIFAPIAAMAAVLLTDATAVAPMFSGVFMEKMVGFIKLYFPVFLLGAIFGKVVEMSGFAAAIVAAAIKYVGRSQTNLVVVLVCALLTYGGVSTFVVVFAVYPFAAELYRQGNIPKRLLPAAIALGSFTFTTDSMPGTPQILNIIPTTFFKTTGWAAPVLGGIGSLIIASAGLAYLEWRRTKLMATGEGYGRNHLNEPAPADSTNLPNAWVALTPLLLVGMANYLFTKWIPIWYGDSYSVSPSVFAGLSAPVSTSVKTLTGIWAVECALLLGILFVVAVAFKQVARKFAEGSKAAAAGALLAAMNTASEYGFGSVIAALPGFVIVGKALKTISDPLINAALSVTTLAGITGSASGGVSIALGAISNILILNAQAAQIPMEVLHRVVSMAGGGMDTLPHNGAVITLLAVTGLTHKQSYGDIFGLTLIKTAAVFIVIGIYYVTGLV